MERDWNCIVGVYKTTLNPLLGLLTSLWIKLSIIIFLLSVIQRIFVKIGITFSAGSLLLIKETYITFFSNNFRTISFYIPSIDRTEKIHNNQYAISTEINVNTHFPRDMFPYSFWILPHVCRFKNIFPVIKKLGYKSARFFLLHMERSSRVVIFQLLFCRGYTILWSFWISYIFHYIFYGGETLAGQKNI